MPYKILQKLFIFSLIFITVCDIIKKLRQELLLMKLREFIYHYAQYCKVNVDAALLMENWTDEDADEKYANYLQEYFRLKPQIIKLNIQKANDAVLLLQTTRVKEVYQELFNLMLKNLKKVRITIGEPKKRAIKERLSKVAPISNNVNYSYIEELRKIEEEEF